MRSRLSSHAFICIGAWLVLMLVNNSVEPLMSYYLALVAMYATAMFGMVILVGLSGQVSLGNGAIMAVGAYVFALSYQHWNAVISMLLAGLAGVVFGLLLGIVGARLRGPYLAGLTLAFAVGIPAIANRFPSSLGGEDGLKVPQIQHQPCKHSTPRHWIQGRSFLSTGKHLLRSQLPASLVL